ncbi:Uncharacterised protein [Starkeya nomas]|uniref:GmrSD restriction endonucleases N-terminal domain-containing protein n=1 Tax=Starkeya nomas TaxID=2666134 RepID=A0A5S9NYJ0_9HYPH|nr:DUF262 domain-containing protein [Starkeya nomas]CAA0095856.1 Uncharacterised protein [Starkeya nomas]
MLKDEIDSAKLKVITDTVQMTIGEISNMYANAELNILPDFQRLFRWTDDRKSNFVESIFIGIPIPPVFVFETENGTWELVDGLQRVSTILEFMGQLRDPDTDRKKRSKLISTKYLASLDNVCWESENSSEKSLDKSLQLFFRRARIDFQILKHPSDPKTKYDLFQRLNRGGAYATEQEVRTCSMVLADSAFTQRMRHFAEQSKFRSMFRISEDQRKSQKDIEYIVRLVVHTFTDFGKGMDVQDFLNHGILDTIYKNNHNNILDVIQWTVDELHRALGDDALIPPEDRAQGIAARFSLRALEGIVVGIARNKTTISRKEDISAYIKSRIEEFWKQPEVVDMSAAGLRGTVRIQKSIPFGERWFSQ